MKIIKLEDGYFMEQHDVDCSSFIKVEDEQFERAKELLNEASSKWVSGEVYKEDYGNCSDFMVSYLSVHGIDWEEINTSPDYIIEW